MRGGIADWYGRCLVQGQHAVGSEAWRECPERHRAQRAARSKKAAQTRWGRRGRGGEHPDVVQGGGDAYGGVERP